MLLAALGVTFFFEGVAEPGVVQRVVATVLIGVTFMLALYAGEVRRPLMRVAGAVVLTLTAGVVIASVADKASAVRGISAIANALLVALSPVAVVIGVIRDLRQSHAVTVTAVAGVLCRAIARMPARSPAVHS